MREAAQTRAFRETLTLYVVAVVTCFALDMAWTGVLAHGFYQRELGDLLRPDVQWVPGIVFYLIYGAALLMFVVTPAADRRSIGRALGRGAFFGLAAYGAYDLTCLTIIRGYSLAAGLVDLAWGAVLSAVVCTVVYLVATRSSSPRI